VKGIYILFIAMVMATMVNAQLSGTKNIPGDYATLAAAVTDLNIQGVGAGGVTLNLVAGNPQTAPAGGYSITATGTLANQITIQGNGNTITASNALTAGSLIDGIFKLIGADYVTIQGFTMRENPANGNSTPASNNMTEWGVALLYASTTNGAQNNSIQNNTIDLSRFYLNTFGIYSNSKHSATVPGTTVTATTAAGTNSGLKIYSNNITDVNTGIVVVGPGGAADHNDGLEIGGTISTGNMITNYGSGTFSGYAGTIGFVVGIHLQNTKNYTVSFNTITSSPGGTFSGGLWGVLVTNSDNTPTGAITNTINNNIISLRSGNSAGTISGIVLAITCLNATATLNINNNDFRNSGHVIAGTGSIAFIYNEARPLNTNINGNTFTNLSVNTTGNVYIIYNDTQRPANAVCNVNGNSIVTAFSKTGAGGTLFLYLSGNISASTATEINNNNNFSNVTVTGNTFLRGWGSYDGDGDFSLPTAIVTGNTFTNWTGGTSEVVCLITGYGGNGITSNNTISNISGAGTVIGIAAIEGSLNIFSNTIYNLSSAGAAAVIGISVRYFVSLVCDYTIHSNKIYDLQTNNAAGTVIGIQEQAMRNVSIYNNLIGNLKAPLANSPIDAIRGINLISPNVSSNLNVYFNTVYINATSAGANFSTAGIFHTTSAIATTGTLDLRNNIIVNLSTPNGTGVTTAYRRSSTDLTNYGTASNNNLLYAGTPGPANLIFFDGTNSDQTLAAYKARVSPIDALSVTENPSFLSLSGANINFLHINPAIATQVDNGAAPITSPFSITDDYDGDIRNISTPDIGADEIGSCAATSWTGSVNTAWENAGNWSCGVPTATTDVTIPGGATIVINSDAHARSLAVNPTANITVNTGFILTVHH
jgi:hypothetical protein